jgi:hypothetical protein
MSRDMFFMFFRPLAAGDAFAHSAPNPKQRSQAEVDRLGLRATAAKASESDSLRFYAGDRDDALGFLKRTSVVVAGLATMVLSETRGR